MFISLIFERGSITVMSLSGLDCTQQENVLLFVCSKAIKSKPVKLETSCTVKLWHTVSVLFHKFHVYFNQ